MHEHLPSAPSFSPDVRSSKAPFEAPPAPFPSSTGKVHGLEAVPRTHGGKAPGKRALAPEVVCDALKLADASLIALAAAATAVLSAYGILSPIEGWERYALIVVASSAMFVVIASALGGYSFRKLFLLRAQIGSASIAWASAIAALLLIGFALKITQTYSRAWALTWFASSFGLLIAGRVAISVLARGWDHHGYLARTIVVVGAGREAERLLAKLQHASEPGISVLGLFDDRRTRVPATVHGVPVLGTVDDLLDYARRTPLDEVVVALPLAAEARLRTVLAKLRQLPVDLRLSAAGIADALPVRSLSYVADVPLLGVAERPLKRWRAVSKWLEDKIIAGLLLILFAPLMLIIAVAIRCDSRGPALFVQERFGFNNRVIRVLKFRTMFLEQCDPAGTRRTVPDDPRVTRIGRQLRKWSFDELPQLLNVLKGEMSLVGPRPHALTMKAGEHLYYEVVQEYFARHRVKPGITGWAQIRGLRGEIDTIEKAKLRVSHDLDYIEHWSLWWDIVIIARTVRMMLTRENAY
jgi:Undecaprenyl-phosphate glucose phosphotransferase